LRKHKNQTGDVHTQEYWDLVSMKQEFGGLGVQNLRDFNLCLLASWIRRYHLDSNKIWRKIVDFKYNLSPNILWARPNSCSPFGKGSFGLLMLLRWGAAGNWVMGKKFCFGVILGLVLVALLSYIGICFAWLMSSS
jgi:hypothetical protein